MNTPEDSAPTDPSEPTSDAPRTGTQAVDRAAAILRAFELDADSGLSVAQVARRVHLTIPTTRRIMHALERAGALDRTTVGETYQLGLGLAVLGGIAMRRMGFAAAIPDLEQLSAQTGEAINLGLLDGSETVTVVHLPSRHPLRLESHPGARNPAHVCAMGKALLAVNGAAGFDMAGLEQFTEHTICEPEALRQELAATRQRGYSITDSERVLGVRAIGAPILAPDGRAIAALAIQAPAVRLTDDRLAEFARLAIETARRIAAGPFGQAQLGASHWLSNIS